MIHNKTIFLCTSATRYWWNTSRAQLLPKSGVVWTFIQPNFCQMFVMPIIAKRDKTHLLISMFLLIVYLIWVSNSFISSKVLAPKSSCKQLILFFEYIFTYQNVRFTELSHLSKGTTNMCVGFLWGKNPSVFKVAYARKLWGTDRWTLQL